MELGKIHLQRESGGWAASLPSGPCAGRLAELCQCELGAKPQAPTPTPGACRVLGTGASAFYLSSCGIVPIAPVPGTEWALSKCSLNDHAEFWGGAGLQAPLSGKRSPFLGVNAAHARAPCCPGLGFGPLG